MDGGVGKAAATGLTESGGIDDLVGQAHAQEPAIGDVEVNFLDQAAFAADTEQIADEEHLEKDDGVDGGAAIVGAIAVANLVANEVKGDELVDFAQEVVLGNEFFERDHLDLKLLGCGFSEHGAVHLLTMHQLDQTPGSAVQGFVSSLKPSQCEGFFISSG